MSGRCTQARQVRERGFTLIELLIALTLLALLSAVLAGSLRMAGRSAEAGEARAEANASMRLAEQFLRTQLEEQHPQRMKKIVDFPLLFGGTPDEIAYAAPLPSRVQGGGVWFYRLRVAPHGDATALLLDRMTPDVNAATMPEFGGDAESSVLADNIKSLKIQYYGRDEGADQSVAPTWRDRWESRQALPLAIRLDVTPDHGPAWPSIVAAPRNAPETGCRGYDYNRQRCVSS